jgi:antitoxin (DNA-binding transcriptional repressor) of toxin-antitoxin stability system
MAQTLIEFRDVPNRWGEIISLAAGGSSVILTEENVPRARLVAIPSVSPHTRALGLHPGAILTSEDFDAALPDEFWEPAQ